MSPAGHCSLFHYPCPSLFLPFPRFSADPAMAGALLYRTDCPILTQATAVATDTIGQAYEVNRKESAVSPREVLFVI